MTANELTQYTLKVLKMNQFEVWRNNAIPVRGRTFMGRKGVADIIGISKEGKFVAIEIKVGKDRLSPEQAEFINMVYTRGGYSFIVSTPNDIDNILKQFKN